RLQHLCLPSHPLRLHLLCLPSHPLRLQHLCLPSHPLRLHRSINMAPRSLSAQLAVDDVVKIMNDCILDPAKKIRIPSRIHCPLCRQQGRPRACMNRKNRDETNYGRILSVCYNSEHGPIDRVTWLTDKLHPNDCSALQQSMQDAVPTWSSSPIHHDAPHQRARAARNNSGRRYLNCIACGKGRGARACDKNGWCKDCCLNANVSLNWGLPVGCHYHGRPPGVTRDWEAEETEPVERGRGGGGAGVTGERMGSGEGREPEAVLPSTQAFHGPVQIGRRMTKDYRAFLQEQLREDEAWKREEREVREQSEKIARLLGLVLFTKTERLMYKLIAQPSDLGGLATQLEDWPKRVRDVVCAGGGEEADEVFLYEPDLQSWASYDSNTYRTVVRGERLLCRLRGVGPNAPGLQAEIGDLPMPLRDARASVDLDLTGVEEVDLSTDLPSQPFHPSTPARASSPPRLLALLDTAMSSPPPSPSLPPSSPPIPIHEILDNAWPGSCSFGTIYSAIKTIQQAMHRDHKCFQEAFHDLYGFDKPYVLP
ncbi:hypothetical protein CALCODRAFT_545092, partial [Calocera cornea HHB12733]